MKTYAELIADALSEIEEIFPWDLDEKLKEGATPILLDVREPDEFKAAHIEGSINVPRGTLETAVEWDFDDTVPELAARRDKEVIVICRSGNRSALAAQTMKRMGFEKPVSLKTGVRGWNDFELPVYDENDKQVDVDDADELLASNVSEEQRKPKDA